MEKLTIYTDGSCKGNPGIGAWGMLVVKPDDVIIVKANRENGETTNNRMELKAIIDAIRYALKCNISVDIYTDSMYCINCYKDWKSVWNENSTIRKSAKNVDLWDELFEMIKDNDPINKIEYVRGHNGNKYNEIIDKVVQGMAK